MHEMRFYGREQEISILKENLSKSRQRAVFTVLMGRIRVGKTTLLKTALEGCEYVYLSISNDGEEMLCQKFQQSLEERLDIHIGGAVNHFCDLFENIMKESVNRHFTVILDGFEMLQKVNQPFSKRQRCYGTSITATHAYTS